MKAVRVPRFGGPEVLELASLPDPVPGPGELLLDVRAAALNWSDLLQRDGTYPGGPQPPFLAGQEAAGIVVAHGPGVTGPQPGARVAAITGRGLHASRAVVPAATCFPIPSSLSFEEGAALLVSLLTAGWALARLGRAAAGETAIIHAAGGGLGTTAVQVAKQLGLNVVATASTEDRRARAAALGADVDAGGWPVAHRCRSPREPRLAFVGARFARTFASPYIRGIARDAAYVARRIARDR